MLKYYLVQRKILYRLLNIVQKTTLSLFNGFWLGLLSPKQLFELDNHFFASDLNEDYASVEWNLKGLHDWEQAVVDTHFPKTGHILILGAGGGREVIALEKQGYTVDAFECNPKLIDAANSILTQQRLKSKVKWHERSKAPETRQKYDGIIIGWGAYMHHQGCSSRIELLNNLSNNLVVDSPLLLSFFTRQPKSFTYKLIFVIANTFRQLRRQPLIELGDNLFTIYAHYFTKEEITKELSMAGLILETFQEAPYGHAVGRLSSS